MADFECKKPKLFKDKQNKKWFIRYSVKYPGDTDWDVRKEYGRTYTEKSLNLIKILKSGKESLKKLL